MSLFNLPFKDELQEEEESLDGCREVGNKVVRLIEDCGSAELNAKTFEKLPQLH